MKAIIYALLCVGLLLSFAVVALAVFGLIVGPGWWRLAGLPFLGIGFCFVSAGLRLWREVGE